MKINSFESEITNQLINCSLKILKLLLDQYDAKVINADFFKKHTQLKIKFLTDHFNEIVDTETKNASDIILRRCNEIISN